MGNGWYNLGHINIPMRLLPSWSRLPLASGLWFLGVIVCNTANGQALPITCTASAVPATVRQGGVTERTSDLLLTCTGGSPAPSDGFVVPMSFTLSLNQPLTTRPLSGGWTESLAIVDEPLPSNQLACSGSEGCPIMGTNTGVGTYSGTPGRPNIFVGGEDGLLYYTIPFDPPGSGQRRIRFTNLRIDASSLAAGTPVVARVDASGQFAINITNPALTVGTVQQAFDLSLKNVQGTTGVTGFTAVVKERFGNAFKSRTIIGPVVGSQANPGGAPLDYETGFFNPNLPNGQQGNLGAAGLADNGTRVRVQISPVLGNVVITAPQLINLAGGQARLVSTSQLGEGAYSPAGSNSIPIVNGVATAVYEVTQVSASLVESLEVPFTIGSASPLNSLNVDLAVAPVGSVTAGQGASATPRFIIGSTSTVTPPLSVPSKTLLSGTVGFYYQDSLSAAGGLSPYSFAITGGALPPGLAFSTTGSIAGFPTSPGSYSFTVTATDSNQATATNTFQITVGGGATLGALPTTVSFNAVQSGPLPLVQDIHIFAQPATNPQAFTIAIDDGAGGPAPSWLHVSISGATTPAILTVSVDQGSLAAGAYNARIRASIPSNPNLAPLDIPITLNVTAAAPKLEIAPNLLSFTIPSAAPGKRTGIVQISNKGGGSINFTTSVVNKSAWIASVSSGSVVDPRNPAQVRVTVDSTGVQPGVYRDIVRVASTSCPTDQPQACDIPVLLRVTPNGSRLTIDRTGLRFMQRPGVATPVTRSVRISSSDPSTSLSWTADVIRGGDWFTLSPASGSASQASPSILNLNVKASASSLAVGSYYGLIRISAPNAVNPTLYVVTVLQVSPASDPVDIDLDPGGLFLTGTARTAQPAQASVIMTADSASLADFQVGAATTDGAVWLSVSPGQGSASLSQSQKLTITADSRLLNSGIYTGSVTVASGAISRAVNVVFIVTDAASDAIPARGSRAASCSPTKAAVAATGMPDNFSIPAGWPSTISVQVRDNCGAAITNATVVARFTNGDPPLSLDADDAPTGIYSSTWQPGVVASPMNVTISALTSSYPEAKAAIAGGVRENKVPTLSRGGTVHPFDRQLGGLLAPGQPVEIYGSGLAGTTEGTYVPLPPTFKGSNVLIGPYDAPLFFVSPGQLNAQLPSELTPGRTYPIVASANGAITLPDQIDVVGVQPGMAAFSDSTLIVQHGSDYSTVTPANPAKRGEFLIMYLVGLGATDPPVATGAQSPSTLPLGIPTNPVTLTIDGAPITPAFVGLTPNGVGLFQINFKVPDSLRLNTPLDVIVKQGSATAKTTTLTVAQ